MGSEVPSGWRTVRLDEVVNDFIVPMRDKPKVFDGEIPWCRIEDFDGVYLSGSKSNQKVSQRVIEDMNLRVFPVGTLLVSCSANLGRCAIVAVPLVSNQTFIGLYPKSETDVLFLYYRMVDSAKALNNLSSGTTISYLSRNEFERFRLLLPPLPEQKKIAAILSSVDEAIKATQAVIEQTRRVKEGLLQDLLTKGIGHTRFKQTEIGEIPEDWEVRRLGDVLDVQLGKMLSPKAKKGVNPRRYLRNVNVRWGRFELDDVLEMDFNDREMEKFALREGDILMCEGGQIGRCAIWRGELSECYYQKALHRLRTKGTDVLSTFAYSFFERHFRFGVSHFVESGATTFAHLTREKLVRMPFCLPSIDEQRGIKDMLGHVDQSIRAAEAKLGAAQAVKAGLLQDLLTGKVRVAA